MSEKIRVLITGANGFLGANILAAMMARSDIEPIAACRNRARLRPDFKGEVRVGDLVDARYRREVVKDIDMICHSGSWASLWAHKKQERQRFFEPTRDLIEQAIGQGVKRFIQTNTVVIGAEKKRRRS